MIIKESQMKENKRGKKKMGVNRSMKGSMKRIKADGIVFLAFLLVISIFVFSTAWGLIIIRDTSYSFNQSVNVTNKTGFAHLNLSDDSIQLYMPFDVNSSVVYDYSKNNNNADLGTQVFTNGLYGMAYNFSKSSISVPYSQSFNFSNSNFTVCGWFSLNASMIGDGSADDILQQDTGGSRNWAIIILDTTGRISFYNWNSTGSYQIATGVKVYSAGGWNHICGRNNYTRIQVFEDGLPVGADKAFNDYTNDKGIAFQIGREFIGTIDDVMVFNRDLSDSEILDLYNNQSVRFAKTGNMTFWDLNLEGNESANITLNDCGTLQDANLTAYFDNQPECYFDNCHASNCNVSVGASTSNLTITFNTASGFYSPLAIGNITIDGFIVFPSVTMTYPQNITYNINVSDINYTLRNNNKNTVSESCWYTNDSGVTNSSIAAAGVNFTKVLSSEGSNTWTVYCNNSIGLENSSTITFFKDTIQPNLTFTSPTPANNTYINVTSIYVNISSADANGITTFTDFNRDLVLWMRMDEYNTTTIFDNSSYGNNGTITGAVYNASGKLGGAYEFDGINDYVNTNYAPDLTDISFSISVWFKSAQNIIDRDEIIGVITDTLSYDEDVTLRIDDTTDCANSGELLFYVRDTDSVLGDIGCSGTTYDDKNWHYAVLVFNDSEKIYLYVDGVEKNHTTITARSDGIKNFAGYPFYVGAINIRGTSTLHFNGTIDNVMIFNRSLTQAEIIALYNGTAGSYNSYHNYTGLADGNYSFTSYTEDIAGNINSSSRRDIVVDTENPNATLLSPANATHSNATSHNFTVNYTDSTALINGTLYVYNETDLYNQTTTTLSGTVQKIGIVISGLVDGIYKWFADVFDKAGNIFRAENNTLTIDTVNPEVNFTDPTPGNNSGVSGNFNLNVSINETNFANVSYNFDGVVVVYDSTSPEVTNLGSGMWGFNLTQTGITTGVTYYYQINVTDIAGNSNSTAKRLVKGNLAPSFISVNITPYSQDDFDPEVSVNITANISDADSNLDSAVLQWKNATSIWTNITMSNSTAKGAYTIMTANITLPSYEDNITYRIMANDSIAVANYSSNYTILSYWDCDWWATPDLGQTAGWDINKWVGNISINNTGDAAYSVSNCSLDFRLTYDTTEGRIYFDNEYLKPSGIYTVASKSNTTILVNATFLTEFKQENVNITISESRGRSNASNANTTLILISNQAGPYLYQRITSNPSSVYLTPSNFSLTGYIRNLMGSAIANESNTAYNVSFNWSLPSEFTNLSGDLIMNFTNMTDIDLNYSSINVTFANLAAATSGVKTFYLYAHGFNSTWGRITDANNNTILTEMANVTFLCYNISDGIYVTACGSLDGDYVAPVTATASTGGGGGGGASGGAGIVVVKTSADFQIVRGKESKVGVSFMNKDENFSIKNVKISVSGKIAKYIEVYPLNLNELAPGQNIEIILKVNAPSYLGLGKESVVVSLTGTRGNIPFSESKVLVLEIHQISGEESANLLKESEDLMNKFKQANLSSADLDALLKESEEALENFNYEKVIDNYNIIKTKVEAAVESKKFIDELDDLTRVSEEKGIDVSGSSRILKLAVLSLERGEYEQALERIKEARVAYALEVKGEIGKLGYYLKNNTKEIGIGALFIALFAFGSYKLTSLQILKNKIKGLREEEKILTDLMRVIQHECFEEKKMSIDEYREAMLQYEKKMASVVEKLIELENKKEQMLRFGGTKKRFEIERTKLIDIMKKLQEDYLVKGKIEVRAYELKIDSYHRRITEIDEKLATMEAKEALKKWKI